jgi:hypothetical protein
VHATLSHKNIFAALPQNKDRKKNYLDTTPTVSKCNYLCVFCCGCASVACVHAAKPHEPIFAALPQDKHIINMKFDTNLIFVSQKNSRNYRSNSLKNYLLDL